MGVAIGAHRDRGQALTTDACESPVSDSPEQHSGGVLSSVTTFLDLQSSIPRKSFFARLFGRPSVPRSLRTQYRVARGDVAVIDVLTQLGPDWLVRTCEPAGGSGIEHIVVGPAGIFCMVVRHQLGGAIWIDGGVLLADGERQSHLRDAEFSAVRLTQVMSDAVGSRVDVTPCLVLLGTRSVTVAKPPKRVAVMTSRDIRTWLKGMPAVVPKSELDVIRASVATHPEWHAVGSQQSLSARTLEMFRKVQAEMIQARHLRLTWVTGALVVLWLIAIVGIGGMTTNFLVN